MAQNSIIKTFLEGLQAHLPEEDKVELAYATGASDELLTQLQQRFPDCPSSLIELLSQINGTYWQDYGEHSVNVLILGSDVEDYQYPYYLKSVGQILGQNNNGSSIREMYGSYLDEDPELVGEGIDPDINTNRWLCFSDCMNNGGTSSLYIDFNPTPTGRKGQIVRYLHDPDSYEVIADSFDEYLQLLIKKDYAFIIEE